MLNNKKPNAIVVYVPSVLVIIQYILLENELHLHCIVGFRCVTSVIYAFMQIYGNKENAILYEFRF